MTSCPAANGMRCVNPSIATVSPSRTVAATACARVRKRDMPALPNDCGFIYGSWSSAVNSAPSGGEAVGAQSGPAMTMISQHPIFTLVAELGEIRHFGQTPYGERRVIDILGGRVEGPRLE